MRKIISLTSILLSSFAFSQDYNPPSLSEETNGFEDTWESGHTTSTNTYGAAFNLGVLDGAANPAYGVEAWYSISENDLKIAIQILSGDYDSADTDEKTTNEIIYKEYLRMSQNTLKLKLRKFFGGSFNVSGGFGFYSYEGEYGFELGGIKDTTAFNGQGFLASLAIGNHWIWDSGFYLGCDWIGFNIPLSQTHDYDDDADIDSTAEVFFDKPGSERSEEFVSVANTISMLTLAVGYEF